MATWQPPIPAGALYSPDALELGAGLALLAWCYDRVERDGSIKINLQKAASDIGKPYGTLRDWWALLKAGPFFSTITPRGKSGWEAQFSNRWLDWRIIANSYPDKQETRQAEEPQPLANAQLERGNTSDEDLNAVSSLANAQLERGNTSDEPRMYKVLHDYQKPSSSSVTACEEKPPQPNREMVMMLFNEFEFKSAKAVNEIAAMQLDLETVRTSIANRLASGDTHGAIVERLRLTPPIRDQPYPRSSRASTGPPQKAQSAKAQAADEIIRRALNASNGTR